MCVSVRFASRPLLVFLLIDLVRTSLMYPTLVLLPVLEVGVAISVSRLRSDGGRMTIAILSSRTNEQIRKAFSGTFFAHSIFTRNANNLCRPQDRFVLRIRSYSIVLFAAACIFAYLCFSHNLRLYFRLPICSR